MNELLVFRLRMFVVEPLKDIVKWDRYAIRDDKEGFIFGWIEREDGGYDFVNVTFNIANGGFNIGFNTSSAKYSKELARRLGADLSVYVECRSAAEILDEAKLVRWQRVAQQDIRTSTNLLK